MFCHLFVVIYITKIIIIIIIIIIIFHKNYFNCFCSGMFRDVPECSVFWVLSTPVIVTIHNLWDKQQQQASRANVMHNMDVLIKFLCIVLGNRSSIIYKIALNWISALGSLVLPCTATPEKHNEHIRHVKFIIQCPQTYAHWRTTQSW